MITGCFDESKKAIDNVTEKTMSGVSSTIADTKDIIKSSVHTVEDKYDNYKNKKKEATQVEIDTCVNSIKNNLPNYQLFLEQNYMDVNQRVENDILKFYQKLQNKGISKDLQLTLNPIILKKLSNSSSTIEYMNTILTILKNIQNELKENHPKDKDRLIKNTQFMMFAWTTPMEILSTHKLHTSSLLGQSKELYKKLNKDNYDNYAKFIYSMLNGNFINENIIIRKSSIFTNMPYALGGLTTLGTKILKDKDKDKDKDKEGLDNVCKDIVESILEEDVNEYVIDNISTNLGIDTDKIQKLLETISKKNNLFKPAVSFKQNLKEIKAIPIVNNPLNDNWYLMLREYMELQDSFYKIKEEVQKVIKILSILPNYEKEVALLTQNLFYVDALYRKFDEVVRYNIIDLPVSIYADLYYIEFKKAKKWYDDDEKIMGNIAVSYNKSCANMQQYMVNEFAISKILRITKTLKKEFNDEEWKEVKTRAKLTQDWFNMLNKVKIENK